MLHGLSANDREGLETAARQHVFEVEEYHALYPQVSDERRMSALRVAARLRRATPQAAATSKQKRPSGPSPLDRDMRIIED